MKKIMMLATILVAGLLFIPNVYADGWMFEDITHDAGNSLVDDQEATPLIGNNKTTITYSGKSFVMLGKGTPETGSEGRPEGYAWIGFKLTAPTDSSDKKLYVKAPGANSFTEVNQDSGKSYTDYVGINEEKLQTALENGTKVTYTFEFAMGEDSGSSAPTSAEYTVIIEIDPTTTVLYPVNTTIEQVKAGGVTIAYNGPIEKQKLDEQKAKEAEAAAAKEKEENNPNTSDINIYLLLSLIAVSGCGIAYTVKRRFN